MDYVISLNNINTILNLIKPGDKIFIKDGEYINQNIILSFKGTFNQRIILQPKNLGRVILSGDVQLLIDGNYITFANIVFKNGGVSNGIQIKGSHNRLTGCIILLNNADSVINVYGVNNRIDHNIFQNFNNPGIWLEVIRKSANNDFVLIDHNVFLNRAEGNSNGYECIRIGTSHNSLSSSKTIVLGNIFEKCNGEIEIISIKSGENLIIKNKIIKSQGTITLRHGNKNIIYNNKFLQENITGTGGIRIIGKHHIIFDNLLKEINGGGGKKSAISLTNGVKNSPLTGYIQVENVKIVRNVLINNDIDIDIVSQGGGTLPPIKTQFIDNLIYKTIPSPIFDNTEYQSPDMLYINNQFYGRNFGMKPKNVSKLLNPDDFFIFNINEDMYGSKEHAGVEWPLDPSSSELKTSIEEYYNTLKNEIFVKLNHKNYLNMYSSESFMSQPISKDDYFNKLQENNQSVLSPNLNSSIILFFIFIKWLIF
jgi:poly(beta-D-mannuronate) lyase